MTRVGQGDVILPPERFVLAYSLLAERAYFSRARPASEIPPRLSRDRDGCPVRDWRAFDRLRALDAKLERLAAETWEWLSRDGT